MIAKNLIIFLQSNQGLNLSITNGDTYDLIEKIRSKSCRRSFTKLYKRIYNRVLSMTYQYCRDLEESRELTQEIFLKIYNNINKLNEAARFDSWLHSIIRNHCLSRRPSREIGLEDDMLDKLGSIEQQSEEETDRNLLRAVIRDIIKKYDCDEQQRRALEMHYTEPPHTVDEIAGELDLKRGTLLSWLSRFRSKIRAQLLRELIKAGYYEE